jgi:hypothetical protein
MAGLVLGELDQRFGQRLTRRAAGHVRGGRDEVLDERAMREPVDRLTIL